MNKSFRSLVSSVLALMMIFSLTACGDGNNPSGGGSNPSGGSSKPGKENVSDFVYVSSFEEYMNDDGYALIPVCFTDTGFYTTGSDVIGQRELEEGETLSYEGQLDIYADTISFVTYDGAKTRLDGYTPFTVETEGEGETDESGITTNGDIELFKLAADENGNLAAIYHYMAGWVDAPEGVTEESEDYWDYYYYRDEWYIRTMGPDGAEKTAAKISSDSDWFYPYGIIYANGRILLSYSDGVGYLGEDGSIDSGIKVDGYINEAFKLRDGSICISYWDNIKSESRIASIDSETGRIAQTWSCPSNAYGFFNGAGDYDFYYRSGINIYGYEIETETPTKLFDWLNIDVSTNELDGFTARDDGSFFAVTNSHDSNWEYKSSEFVTVTRKAASDVAQKPELTLACWYTDTVLENAVVKFNRNNDVRIRVIDYSQYDNEEDWNAGFTKLTTEIMAGNMPDIISLNGLPYKQLAAKGLIEDLYPYIDADSEINRSDFMPNVLSALEVGGKLCTTVTTFTIDTLAGAAEKVGNKPGWTFDDLAAAMKTMDKDATALDQNTTSGDILRKCLTLDMDSYIDWTTGECRFDSEEFIALLNFAKSFPNSFDWGTVDWEEYQSIPERIAAGKQLLMEVWLGDFSEIVYNEYNFGGDMTYIGYPCSSGNGSYMTVISGYAMSSKCADKDAAWQFLRSFLSSKGSDDLYSYYGGFPVNKAQLEERLKEAMTVEYVKDENGKFAVDENGERIPLAKFGVWSEELNEPIYIYSITQEQADKVMDVIQSTTRLYDEDTTILDIICELTDAFFAGEKTAEETARLIQAKLSIYVNEQR